MQTVRFSRDLLTLVQEVAMCCRQPDVPVLIRHKQTRAKDHMVGINMPSTAWKNQADHF